jgi:hypothetical protein
MFPAKIYWFRIVMARQALVVLGVVVAFGVLVPWYKGFGFLDPRIIAAYACLALLFVAPASAEIATLYAQKASPATILGRIGVIVAYGWGITVLILVTGLVTVNLTNRRGGFAAPASGFLSAVLVFSLIASLGVAALSAVLARRFSASGVKAILRTGFLLVLLVFVFGSRFLPESWQLEILDHFSTRRALTRLAWEGSAGSAVIAAALLIPLLKRPGEASS